MVCASGAIPIIAAAPAAFTHSGKRLPEDLKTFIPDLRKRGLIDIPLDCMGISFYVQACAYIAVCHDPRCINSCIAEEIPVPYLPLIIEADKVAASISDRHLLTSLFIYEGNEAPLVIRCKHQFRTEQCPADRLQPDYAPRINIHLFKNAIEFIQLPDVFVIDDCCDLDGTERLFLPFFCLVFFPLCKHVLYAVHGKPVSSRQTTKAVMRFFQAVNGNRDRCHSCLIEFFSHGRGDQSRIACHPPRVPQSVCIAKDIKEVRAEKRFPACDTQHQPADIKVLFDLVKDPGIYSGGKPVRARSPARASTVEACLIAFQSQFEKELAQLRLPIKAVPVFSQFFEVLFFQGVYLFPVQVDSFLVIQIVSSRF